MNRYVDSESKGPAGQDNITIRVCTQFSGTKSAAEFQSESIRNNAIIIDLSEGSFIDELIRANKIATFRRNNSASMSATLTEIMSKKSAEMSDRIKRAEDMIRAALRTAPIYLAGTLMDIKQKDGKDRMQDALKEMVKRDYFKLTLSAHSITIKIILYMLTDSSISLFDISSDANKGAYDEILKIRDDKRIAGKQRSRAWLIFTGCFTVGGLIFSV